MGGVPRFESEEKTVVFLMKKDDRILSTFPFNLEWEC